MTPATAELLGGREATHMIAPLTFAEDVRVDREHGAGIVAQVLGDLPARIRRGSYLWPGAAGGVAVPRR
ncbi:hypothetical protein [Microbacterium dauci]|uniref:Uncharacterized protein n=1 Tax=Microbacterium dauci TaxID=3048008 RepID=A0ABT6ZEG2_9MICO|nr:hypothetical protein [Microbacterium sp. LX3-4]MDJ1114545.1 hypothetical protein [Microbacterium sp. LX3-4]